MSDTEEHEETPYDPDRAEREFAEAHEAEMLFALEEREEALAVAQAEIDALLLEASGL